MFYTNAQTVNSFRSSVFHLLALINFGLLFSCLSYNCYKKKHTCEVKWREETIRKKTCNVYEDKSHFQIRIQNWCRNKTQRHFRDGLVLPLDVRSLPNHICCLADCLVQRVWRGLLPRSLHSSAWVSFCKILVALVCDLEGEYSCKMLGKASSKGKGEKILRVWAVNVNHRAAKQDSEEKWARRSGKWIQLKIVPLSCQYFYSFFVLCYIFLYTKPEKKCCFFFFKHTIPGYVLWSSYGKLALSKWTLTQITSFFFYVADKTSCSSSGIRMNNTKKYAVRKVKL